MAHDEALRHQLQLFPNCALTWRGALFFYAFVSASSLGVAIYFTVHGYWPVLPFAGLELAALGVALWISMQRGAYREIISIYPDRIVIEKGRPNANESTVFPLHWAHVNLRHLRTASHPSKLTISSHGRSCEIGACLTESERLGLSRRLEELIGQTKQTPLEGH